MTAECTIGEFYVYQAEKNTVIIWLYPIHIECNITWCLSISVIWNKLLDFCFIVGAFVTGLYELDRQDAADVVLNSAPIYKIIHDHSNV